jgi:virulence-associated protein VapD
MAQSFRHHTDGWVAIANNDTEFMYPYAWWITQETSYTLPSPYIYREYIKGSHHRVFTDIDQFLAREGFPWADGDIYIAKKSIYDAAYAAYINTPLTLEQAKAIKFSQLNTKFAEVLSGMIVYGGINYPSNETVYFKLFSECNLYTGLGSVPIGYYILDENRNEVSSTLLDLQAIIVLIQELHHDSNLSYDIHYAAIDVLTDMELVNSYDVTTGWPTTPYKVFTHSM